MCSFTFPRKVIMGFRGQKIQPTLMSGDKSLEAGTDQTLPSVPSLEHLITDLTDQHNLPALTPSICLLDENGVRVVPKGFE